LLTYKKKIFKKAKMVFIKKERKKINQTHIM
jgi:hypothetical protein